MTFAVRSATAALLAALVAVLSAAPALAHGAGGADVSNYRSTVTGLADGTAEDGTPGPPAPAVAGLEWRVVANDALLEVRNTTERTLVVQGYEGEPYLRIDRDGVFENRRSPAVYLNTDRFGDVEVPVSADPGAAPEWVRVGDGPAHAWHDHRIHWMAATLPPQVKVDPGAEHTLFAWAVPFRLGDEDLAVAGELHWVPGPPAWPWLLGMGLLLLAPVVVVAARGGARRALLRTAAAVVAAVVVADVVRAVDDLVSVPASVGEIALEAARVGLFVAVAGFGAWRAARDDGTALPALVVAAAALLLGLGLPDAAVLTASQVTGVLPAAAVRVVAAANLTVIAPVALAVALSLRSERRQPAPSAPEPSSIAR